MDRPSERPQPDPERRPQSDPTGRPQSDPTGRPQPDPTGSVVLRPRGDLDLAAAPTFRRELAQLGDHPATIIVELGAVDFVDSVGLGVLIGGLRRARERGGAFVLRNPSDDLTRLLSLTGLDQVFDIGEPDRTIRSTVPRAGVSQ